MNESIFTVYQETYPALQKYTYLNTANCGLLSTATQQVVQQAMQQYAEQGSLARDDWYEKLAAIRQSAAGLLGATTSELALITNFTSGIYNVAQLLRDYRRVLVVVDDYPTLVLPWHLLGFEVFTISSLPDGRIPLEAIEQSIRQHDIQVLAVSHVQYSSGFRLPLASLGSICQGSETLLVVDATQSLGIVPINLSETPVDVLIASGYKWLNAGLGNGLLYIREKLHQALSPQLLGFGTVGSQFSAQQISRIPFTPSTLEAGHYNFFSLLALQQALEETKEIGIFSIFDSIMKLRTQLVQGLPQNIELVSDYPADNSSSIVVVKASENAEAQLKAQNIITSTRPKGLRISPHFYNNEADIQKLCSALSTL